MIVSLQGKNNKKDFFIVEKLDIEPPIQHWGEKSPLRLSQFAEMMICFISQFSTELNLNNGRADSIWKG